jgi:hypothetical protein
MPRDTAGNYTLPTGNPVIANTPISSGGWANPTLDDIGSELSKSLDRLGRGGMLAPFKFLDGTKELPGMTWTNEATTGFFREGAGKMTAGVLGQARMRWTASGIEVRNLAVIDPEAAGAWVALTTGSGLNFVQAADSTNYAKLDATNTFTMHQRIQHASASLNLWKDATPTVAGAISVNNLTADALELVRYNGSAWERKISMGAVLINYFANTHVFYDAPGTTERARFSSPGVGLTVWATNGERGIAVMGASGSWTGLDLTDGQAGTQNWTLLSGYPVTGDFSIFNATAGTPVFKITAANLLTVRDPYLMVHHPVGYKSCPPSPLFVANTTMDASRNGTVARFVGGAGVTFSTYVASYDGEAVTVANNGTAPLTLACSGVLRWFNGSAVTDASPRTLAVGGVATLISFNVGVNNWMLWGSGLS